MSCPDLTALLDTHRARLLGFVRAEGKAVLRHESEDDLVQGIHAHALAVAERFEYRSEGEFVAWLYTVARQHLANRVRYWTAARRNAGHLLRVTQSGRDTADSSGVVPPAGRTGPGTLAGRREELQLAAKVVRMLSDRDQQLVQWMTEDVPLEEVAERLGMSYEATKKARHRAMDRFRKTFELVQKRAR
ncbi:MAG: RNA polymerase sigma factor [Planctomycetota bacterium JB042]